MNASILTPSDKNMYWFELFKSGDETGLDYIYRKMSPILRNYGRRLCNDEFYVKSFIQDAFLRVWINRERVTSLFHLFCFLRLVMRWENARYYAALPSQNKRRIYFHEYNESIAYENYSNSTWHQQVDSEISEIISERAVQIDLAIEYLPDYDKKIMILYYHQGLSEKQIARKFNNTHQSISNIIRKNTDKLKSYLLRSPPRTTHTKRIEVEPDLINELSPTQMNIYRLRMVEKYPFDKISEELKTPIEIVISQYTIANELSIKVRSHAKKGYNNYPKNTIAHR